MGQSTKQASTGHQTLADPLTIYSSTWLPQSQIADHMLHQAHIAHIAAATPSAWIQFHICIFTREYISIQVYYNFVVINTISKSLDTKSASLTHTYHRNNTHMMHWWVYGGDIQHISNRPPARSHHLMASWNFTISRQDIHWLEARSAIASFVQPLVHVGPVFHLHPSVLFAVFAEVRVLILEPRTFRSCISQHTIAR